MENVSVYNLCIIGGDASGLAAAIAAAEKDHERSICVLERNAIAGRKLNATGNGRCNYLNKNAGPDSYYSSSDSKAKEALLEAVFDEHPVMKVAEWFAGIGIIPTEEEEGRLYPRSLQAKSVSDALIKAAERRDIEIMTNFSVSYVNRKDGRFEVVSDTGAAVYCDRLILACGGKAGIQYGCFGDGYRFAKAFGHNIIKPIPALTQLTVDGIEELFGVRVKCRIGLYRKSQDRSEEKVSEDSGELQFTKDSLSGICTFNVSRFLRISPDFSYVARLDLFEEYTEEELAALFEARYSYFGFLKDVLAGLLPDKLVEYILDKHSCSASELAAVCKSLPFTVTGSKSFKDAQVTSGGIDLAEVNPKSLESTLVKGLFFAGEILDVDAKCGGYNLSFAFASGLLAGENA